MQEEPHGRSLVGQELRVGVKVVVGVTAPRVIHGFDGSLAVSRGIAVFVDGVCRPKEQKEGGEPAVTRLGVFS